LLRLPGTGLTSQGSTVVTGICGLRQAHKGQSDEHKIILVLVVAITAALVTQPASAGTVHSFVFTENSPTSLTVTYDGSPLTVTFSNSDIWTFSLPVGFSFNDVGFQQWTEPENSYLANFVSFGTDVTRGGFVESDHSISNQFPINADGATVEVGTDGGVPVFATFNDNAAGFEKAPDTGSTMGLFFLALTAVFGPSRLRSRQST